MYRLSCSRLLYIFFSTSSLSYCIKNLFSMTLYLGRDKTLWLDKICSLFCFCSDIFWSFCSIASNFLFFSSFFLYCEHTLWALSFFWYSIYLSIYCSLLMLAAIYFSTLSFFNCSVIVDLISSYCLRFFLRSLMSAL